MECESFVQELVAKLLTAANVGAMDPVSKVVRQVGYLIKKKLVDIAEFLKEGLQPIKCFSHRGRLQFKFLLNSQAFFVPVDHTIYFSF